MTYAAFVLLGIGLAFAAMRLQPRSNTLAPHERNAVRLGAVAGAVIGAFGLQLPADLLGWSAPPPAAAGDALPLGGRTVLGGLLGGWLGVEAIKKLAGVRAPTGGDFALPLALALCCGRLGCWSAGCCAGAVCAPAWYATTDAAGIARWPVQLIEAGFHGLAVPVLAVAAWRCWWPTQRLAAYLAAYALLRFGLEFLRQHPPLALGLSWHQYLAGALLALAGITWWRRRSDARPMAPGRSEPFRTP